MDNRPDAQESPTRLSDSPSTTEMSHSHERSSITAANFRPENLAHLSSTHVGEEPTNHQPKPTGQSSPMSPSILSQIPNLTNNPTLSDILSILSTIRTEQTLSISALKDEMKGGLTEFRSDMGNIIGHVDEIGEKMNAVKVEIHAKLDSVTDDINKRIYDCSQRIQAVSTELNQRTQQTEQKINENHKEIRKELSDNIDRIQGKITEWKKSVATEIGQVSNQQVRVEKKYTELDTTVKSNHTGVTTELKNLQGQIDSTNASLVSVKNKMDSISYTERISSSEHSVPNLFNTLAQFDNTTKTVHPKEFVRQIQTINDLQAIPWRIWQLILATHLQGEALIIFRNRLCQVDNLNEFITLFLKTFWNLPKQQILLSQIICCQYNANRDHSLPSFAADIRYKNSFLDNSLDELSLIHIILKKLPSVVQLACTSNAINNFDEFEEYLQRIESAGIIDKNMSFINNNNNNNNSYKKNGKHNEVNRTDEIQINKSSEITSSQSAENNNVNTVPSRSGEHNRNNQPNRERRPWQHTTNNSSGREPQERALRYARGSNEALQAKSPATAADSRHIPAQNQATTSNKNTSGNRNE